MKDTRNRILGTNCTEKVVSCISFRAVPGTTCSTCACCTPWTGTLGTQITCSTLATGHSAC
eukprot:2128691-Rhodomonas_salina.1